MKLKLKEPYAEVEQDFADIVKDGHGPVVVHSNGALFLYGKVDPVSGIRYRLSFDVYDGRDWRQVAHNRLTEDKQTSPWEEANG